MSQSAQNVLVPGTGDDYFRQLVLSVPVALYVTDAEGRITLFNECAAKLWGREPEVGVDRWCGSWKILNPEDDSPVELDLCPMAIALKEGRVVSREIVVERPDGTRSAVLPHPRPITNERGEITGAINVLVDLSERKAWEARLAHSHKMEAVGSLAGGIAHDFNNLLAVILGYAEKTEDALGPDDPLRENIRQISGVAMKAGALTGQLLTFASRSVVCPRDVDLNELVSEATAMLRGALGGHILIVTELSQPAPTVHIDPIQFDQVMVNLAVNAKDAMPGGGKLIIRTRTETVDGESYAILTVADTGCGIPEDILPRVMEPFFTTKRDGEGTGLGLATCYGIIRQAGGRISISSSAGEGTRVEIALPSAQKIVASDEGPAEKMARIGGHETILIADDEALLLQISSEILESNGYTVLSASDGAEALNVSRDHDGQIDLLVTDVYMPHVNGVDLANQVREFMPELPVLFISGYTGGLLEDLSVPRECFLAKPFAPADLMRHVRALLDSSAAEKPA